MKSYSSRGSSPPQQAVDPSLDRIVLVDQLPSEAWVEGLAVRPSGQILATRLDGNKIYTIDLRSNRSFPETNFDYDPVPPKLLLTIPDINTIFNICPLTGTEREDYAVLSGFADFAQAEYHSVTVWRMSFDPDDPGAPPTMTKIADMPDALYCLGMITVSDKTLIIADTTTHCIWRVDVLTGKTSMLMQDKESMSAATKDEIFGVNRIRLAAGYLWYTNTSSGVLYRAPIKYTDDNLDINVTGPAEAVADGLQHGDGLVMRPDGTAGYVACYVQGIVWRIDVDSKSGKGTVSVLMDGLITPTTMDLRYEKANGKPTLYVMCVGAVSPALFEGDNSVVLTLANLDKSKLHIMITVTTEVTYEYI